MSTVAALPKRWIDTHACYAGAGECGSRRVQTIVLIEARVPSYTSLGPSLLCCARVHVAVCNGGQSHAESQNSVLLAEPFGPFGDARTTRYIFDR